MLALIGAALKKSTKLLPVEKICPSALAKVNHGALDSAPPGLIPARPREALSFPVCRPLPPVPHNRLFTPLDEVYEQPLVEPQSKHL